MKKPTSINGFITDQADKVLRESAVVARDKHANNLGEQQALYCHIGSQITANILFSLWCSIKIMGGTDHANDWIDELTVKIKDKINQKGDKDEK